MKITQQDFAGYLGLTRETVSRALSSLRALGLIEMRGRHIVLHNRAELVRLVESPDLARVLPDMAAKSAKPVLSH